MSYHFIRPYFELLLESYHHQVILQLELLDGIDSIRFHGHLGFWKGYKLYDILNLRKLLPFSLHVLAHHIAQALISASLS